MHEICGLRHKLLCQPDRQFHHKGRTAAGPSLRACAAAVVLADGLDQCQAQANAAFTLAGARQAVKGLKNSFSLIQW